MTAGNKPLWLVLAVVGAALASLAWLSEPRPRPTSVVLAGVDPAPSARAVEQDDYDYEALIPEGAAVRGPGGDPSFTFAGRTFTVPEPGDAEWEDYQEMLKHPRVRTSVQSSPGYAIPYDPEWRSMITGRREVAANDLPVVGGAGSLASLVAGILEAVHAGDADVLSELGVEKEQWEEVYWPEFPQSRPYLKIPADEAWDLHRAENRSGINRLLREWAGRDLAVESISHGDPRAYTNFTLIPDLRIQAVDPQSGERVEIEAVRSVALRQARYKVFMYSES